MKSGTALYPVELIRKIEQAAMADLPAGTLMQKAGQAAASVAMELLQADYPKAKVLILAGPGNNGGDALVVATRLAEAGVQVTALFETEQRSHLPPDAQKALELAQGSPIRFENFSFLSQAASIPWDLVVDGLFGIGLRKSIGSPYREAIELVNTFSCPILALDVPSGLNADTGTIAGNDGVADGIAIIATHTITFIGDKPGLHTADGRDHAGVVKVADLDIDALYFSPACIHRNDVALFSHVLKKRPQNSHKGSYGDISIAGGSTGMHGAAILAGCAALKSGAGRVFVGFLEDPPAYDSAHPELMCRQAQNLDYANGNLIVGPGMGKSASALETLAQAMGTSEALVLDADALNMLAVEPDLQQKLRNRAGSTLMTPHPLEAARLLSVSSKDIQADRLSAAKELAGRFQAVVILKGAGTVIADPKGNLVINDTGNPALATAGTGDVLSGICGALLAQGIPVWEAALIAVWVHGKAADELVKQGVGPIGLAASELIPYVRSILNRLVNGTMDS